ncbi:MAG: glycosyltransferase involved in cell wall biosynthesis [Mariniflexile sp.]|jgi:glycosyltransferase involved in cell wall biosynthesis
MKHIPKVIGLVPTYQSEKIIGSTLKALGLQDYPNFEVLVCDDCSTDKTFEICRDFAKNHPNFTVLRNETNIGWFSNAEKLWNMAVDKGHYCFLNPHDDPPFPTFVSKQVKVLEKNSSAVLSIPGMENAYPNGEIIHSQYTAPVGKEDVVERVFTVIEGGKYWWAGFHGLHRSEAVKQILPVAKLRFGEKEYSLDSIWLIKLAFLGEFEQVPEVLFRKNYYANSLSKSWKRGIANKLARWVAIFEAIKKANIHYQLKAKLRKKVYKLLANRFARRIKRLQNK